MHKDKMIKPLECPKKAYIIAEAGVNHNGDIRLAKELVAVAADAGANAVKFQTFKADYLASKDLHKAAYQARNDGDTGSQYDMLRRLELSDHDHHILLEECQKRGIDFLSSPFDIMSAGFLINDLRLDTVKIGSGELTNAPLLFYIAQQDVRVILSTGMANLSDIEEALSVLAYGYLSPQATIPTLQQFKEAFYSPEGDKNLKEKVILLHCTSEYPCPPEEVNLRSMLTLADAFKLPVGFSDHTAGTHIPLCAITLGATVIEKHFTLDKTLPGPDHKASLDPKELSQMVLHIREAEAALGNGRKVPTPAELLTAKVVRKTLVTSRALKAGDRLTEESIKIIRTNESLSSPLEYWTFLNKKLNCNLPEGAALHVGHLEKPNA